MEGEGGFNLVLLAKYVILPNYLKLNHGSTVESEVAFFRIFTVAYLLLLVLMSNAAGPFL